MVINGLYILLVGPFVLLYFLNDVLQLFLGPRWRDDEDDD